jgi:exonuclease SbcC
MRPLRLTIEGLRSYRARQEISFEGLGLFAITGPTGAGKSSILEAMVYALFGCSTWDAKTVRELICDGADSMTVSFEFEARGRRWRVLRSAWRKAKQPVHQLRCLDGEASAGCDGERAVSERIRELLGMDYKNFLKCVVLPQGRFAALLHSTDSDRGTLLRSLLGLDDLEAMKTALVARKEEFDRLLNQVRGQRSQLPADPAAAVAAARQELEGAEGHWRQEQEIYRQALELARQIEDRRRAVSPLQERLQLLSGLPPRPGAGLAELGPREAELEAAASELAALRADVEARARQADEARRRLEQSGRGRQRLQAWRDQAQTLAALEPQLSRLRDDLAARRAALEGLATELEGLEARHLEATARRDRLVEQGREAASREKDLAERLTRAEASLAAARAAEERRLRQVRALEEKIRAAGALAAQLEQARAALQEASRARAQAEQTLEQRRRENLVSALCQGVHAGDPCPVCSRALPSDFQAPAAAGLREAEQGLQQAVQAEEAARQQVQRLQGEVDTLQALAAEIRAGEARAAQERDAALNTVTDLGGAPARLEEPDEQILADLRACLQEARGVLEGLRKSYAQAQDEVGQLSGRLEQTRRQKAADESAASRLADELAAGEREVARHRAELAAAFGLAEADDVARKARERADQELRHLDELHERAAAAAAELQEVTRRQEALEARRREEVEAPLRQIENRLREMRQVLAGLDPGCPSLGPRPSRAELGALADGLAQLRDRLLQETRERLSLAGQEVAGLEARLEQVLKEQGAEGVEELERRARQAEHAVLVARGALERTESEARRARRLDEVLVPAEKWSRAYEFLKRALSNQPVGGARSFFQWLLEKRQRELLELASRRLGEMTAGHYGFSPRFQIVDRRTRQERDPRTLSGGESFLASLSLALALSDLLGRKGGKLEAFFLDEGFGNLSPESLQRALDALEALSQTGRLIGVISHVEAVTEHVDTVWRVERGAQGSTVRPLEAWERQSRAREALQEALG